MRARGRSAARPAPRPAPYPQPAPHRGPRHAAARGAGLRGIALLGVGALTALGGAVLLATMPASAEAAKTTATLTLLGIRDSNCDFQTGGTTAYVKPGGSVTFKGELAGLSVKVPGLGTIPISSSKITSFNYKLVIDGDKRHAHKVNGKKKFTLSGVSRNHGLAWSANSVDATVPILGGILGTVIGHKSITVPLHGSVAGLPAGAKLDWVGKVVASSKTKCGIAEIPGAGVTLGPITLSVPPITGLPSQPDLGKITSNLPGGGGNGGGGGGSGGTGGGRNGGDSGPTLTPPGTMIPAMVVPNAGSGGDSAFGGTAPGGGGGGFAALPDSGGGVGGIGPAVTRTVAAPPSSPANNPSRQTVDLATDATDNGINGPELPVLLAIVAIIALSLVTAGYARMYLMKRPSA